MSTCNAPSPTPLRPPEGPWERSSRSCRESAGGRQCHPRHHLCIRGAYGWNHGNYQQHLQQHRRQRFLLHCHFPRCCETDEVCHLFAKGTIGIWISVNVLVDCNCSKYGRDPTSQCYCLSGFPLVVFLWPGETHEKLNHKALIKKLPSHWTTEMF